MNYTQTDRFRDCRPRQPHNCIEHGIFDYCEIYNISNIQDFIGNAVEHLTDDVNGNLPNKEENAEAALDTIAEFVVWHLVIKLLAQFSEEFAQNGQCYQWFSKASPQYIDIVALAKSEADGWFFHVIEVKWSEKCNYNQVARLYDDLAKLHNAQYSCDRLGTHVTAMKTHLKRFFSPSEMEDIFRHIQPGQKPSDTKGIKFWGFFVSDWNHMLYDDPNLHFQKKLIEKAQKDTWPDESVSGYMLNIGNVKNTLMSIAMGRVSSD